MTTEVEPEVEVEVEALDPADVETWWHGGPIIDGSFVLPRRMTGAESTFETVKLLGLTIAEDSSEIADQAVFVTARREVAEMFASMMRHPWVYEVRPIGEMALDPLWNGKNLRCDSVMVGTAEIVRRFNPSKDVRRRWRGTIESKARGRIKGLA